MALARSAQTTMSHDARPTSTLEQTQTDTGSYRKQHLTLESCEAPARSADRTASVTGSCVDTVTVLLPVSVWSTMAMALDEATELWTLARSAARAPAHGTN